MDSDLCISQGKALDVIRNRRFQKLDFVQISKDVLSSSGFLKPIIDIRKSPESSEVLDSVVELTRKRLQRLHEKASKAYKQRKTEPGKEDFRNDVFLDLSDFPSLLNTNSQCSQSQSSRCSTQSDLEVSIPYEPPKKRKTFDELSSATKRARTSDLYEHLLQTAKSQDISPGRMAAYLGSRSTYMSDKALSHSFQSLYDGSKTLNKIDSTLAVYLKEHCQIGRSVYTDLRLLLQKHVEFPPYNELAALVKNILPDLISYDHGVRAGFKDLLLRTLGRILSRSSTKLLPTTISSGIVCQVKVGIDGSGSHAIYNSASSLREGVDTSHMLVAGFSVPQITVNDSQSSVIFRDRHCSSVFSERPMILIPGGETAERFGRVLQLIESEIDEMSSGIEVKFSDAESEKTIHCTVLADVSQLDGKAICTATGLKGAYCTGCTVSESDAKKLERIEEGFSIDRNIDDLNDLYTFLLEDEDGDPLHSRQGDYWIRAGLTQKPQSTSLDLCRNIPVVHAYLRSLSYFEDLVYRVNSNLRKMVRGTRYSPTQKDRLTEAKRKMRLEAKEGPLHLRLDCPDSYGHGGSSDTGVMARRFFEERNRPHVVALMKGTVAEKEGLCKLHEQFSVVLRVMSSKFQTIDVIAYEELCLEAYKQIVITFPWASIPQSIHRFLAHSGERIRFNDAKGLGNCSKEGLEALHKYVRKFRCILARKTSLKDNLSDVFSHLFVRSDPVIRCQRRVLECSHCHDYGHSKRSCPSRRQMCASSDDALVQNIFMQ